MARQTATVTGGQCSALVVAFILLFSGLILDIADLLFTITDAQWTLYSTLCADSQMAGALAVACIICPYGLLRIKGVTFLLCIWRAVVLIGNLCLLHKSIPVFIYAGINAVYFIWLYRIGRMRTIPDREPLPKEAYYIFLPVNSYQGLLQSVFMPWHPPRYETRMISDGQWVWSVYRGKFAKKLKSATNIDKLDSIKIPFNRRMTNEEYIYLNSLIGLRAIPFFRDCRKFLIRNKKGILCRTNPRPKNPKNQDENQKTTSLKKR